MIHKNKFISKSILLVGLFLQFFASIFYLYFFTGNDIGKGIYLAVKVLMICLLFSHIYLYQNDIRRNFFKGTLLGISSGIFMCLFIALCIFVFGDFISIFIEDLRVSANNFGFLNNYIAFSLFFIFFNSLFEELYWRVFIFSELKYYYSPLLSAIISSIAFSLHHIVVLSTFFPMNVAFLLSAFIVFGGCIWCFIYQKGVGVFSIWISHAMVDFALILFGYLLLFSS